MAKGWKQDKAWSDIFIPEIQRVLGEVFFSLPLLSDDQMKNTDLICLDMSGKRIGCRIRREQYLKKYAFQFTIRSSRPGGTKTEYQKILEGWGDYFFYGFANSVNTSLLLWFVGDLEVFRQFEGLGTSGMFRQNTDGSSSFKAFDWTDMPKEFFIKISPSSLLINDRHDYGSIVEEKEIAIPAQSLSQMKKVGAMSTKTLPILEALDYLYKNNLTIDRLWTTGTGATLQTNITTKPRSP